MYFILSDVESSFYKQQIVNIMVLYFIYNAIFDVSSSVLIKEGTTRL